MISKFAIGFGVVTVLLLFIWFCTPIRYLNLVDHYGPSNDITESKRRGVYLFSYKVINQQPINLGDGVALTIADAWIERQWKAGTFDNETVVLYGAPAKVRSRVKFDVATKSTLPEWAREIIIPAKRDGGVVSAYDPSDTAYGGRHYHTFRTESPPPTELIIPILRRNDSTKTVWVSADTIGYIHLKASDW